jgi:hypothetical protein
MLCTACSEPNVAGRVLVKVTLMPGLPGSISPSALRLSSGLTLPSTLATTPALASEARPSLKPLSRSTRRDLDVTYRR